jgi:guanylate kinase
MTASDSNSIKSPITPLPETGLLFMISGPSGVGKSTLIKRLHAKFDFLFCVSATTRPRAENETDGVDYHFIDTKTFKQWVAEDRFLEYAQVYGRNFYGTPREAVAAQLRAGRIVILDVDVQGARQLRAKATSSLLGVFILPPSNEALHERLISRARDTPEVIERRFAHAKEEIAAAQSEPIYDALIVNNDLDRATAELDGLLANALAKHEH